MTSPNGCMVADTCMPMLYGNDGAQCPGMCPIQCPEDHMHCGGGMDAAGCPMPDTCMPMTGTYMDFVTMILFFTHDSLIHIFTTLTFCNINN